MQRTRNTLTLHDVAEKPDDGTPLTIDEIDEHIRTLVPKIKWRLQYNGTMATTDVYAEVWERVWRVQLADAQKLSKAYIARAIRNLIVDQKRARARRGASGFERADGIEVDDVHRTLTPNAERLVEVQSDAMACALVVESLRQGIGMPSFLREDTRRNLAEVLEAVLNNPLVPDAEIARQLGISPQTYGSRKQTLLKYLKPVVRNALREASVVESMVDGLLEGAPAAEVDRLRAELAARSNG
ncbi:MAG: hypothetical protein R3F61_01575 [Myxococcota bacterium]